MRRNPLCRALRVDKVTLAGLEATLRLYRDPSEALERVPTLRMLTAAVDGLEARARALVATAAERGLPLEAAPGRSAVGGGTFPGVELPSWTVTTRPSGVTLDDLARRLRAGSPPLVARREEGALVLDLRTVLPEQDEIVLACLVDALEPDEA
jgi:L-seryl-tRNA(Ser) seleniumtransferase